MDLAVHTAPLGRSRAIDRIARQQARAASRDPEAALVLRALETAWFSVFRVIGPHPEAGLLLEDVMLGGEVWVIDRGLALSAPPGTIFGSRLGRVRGFAITCGVLATLDEMMLAGFRRIIAESGMPPALMTADPRFAMVIYQQALGYHVGEAFDPS